MNKTIAIRTKPQQAAKKGHTGLRFLGLACMVITGRADNNVCAAARPLNGKDLLPAKAQQNPLLMTANYYGNVASLDEAQAVISLEEHDSILDAMRHTYIMDFHDSDTALIEGSKYNFDHHDPRYMVNRLTNQPRVTKGWEKHDLTQNSEEFKRLAEANNDLVVNKKKYVRRIIQNKQMTTLINNWIALYDTLITKRNDGATTSFRSEIGLNRTFTAIMGYGHWYTDFGVNLATFFCEHSVKFLVISNPNKSPVFLNKIDTVLDQIYHSLSLEGKNTEDKINIRQRIPEYENSAKNQVWVATESAHAGQSAKHDALLKKVLEKDPFSVAANCGLASRLGTEVWVEYKTHYAQTHQRIPRKTVKRMTAKLQQCDTYLENSKKIFNLLDQRAYSDVHYLRRDTDESLYVQYRTFCKSVVSAVSTTRKLVNPSHEEFESKITED
jgi:hypothetical protein